MDACEPRDLAVPGSGGRWPPGTLTVDQLPDDAYFLIGTFDTRAIRWARKEFVGWTVLLESTATMMLIAPPAGESTLTECNSVEIPADQIAALQPDSQSY